MRKKLIFVQQVKKFRAFYGNQSLTVSTIAAFHPYPSRN
jgi:hypothetical protein